MNSCDNDHTNSVDRPPAGSTAPRAFLRDVPGLCEAEVGGAEAGESLPRGVEGHPDRRPTLLLDSVGARSGVMAGRNYSLEASMVVRVDLNISLDGVATTTDQTPEHPMGQDWSRLVAAYVATRTFRERVLHDTTGEGTTGVDDDYAKAYFAEGLVDDDLLADGRGG